MRWLASHVAAIGSFWSCMYAAVVQPSYSMTTRLLPYGLSLFSSVAGRPGWADILGWLVLPRMVCMLGKSIHIP